MHGDFKVKFYISGGIEASPDFGKNSRQRVREMLDLNNIEYFCPALSEENLRNMQLKESLKDIINHQDEPWEKLLKERINPIVNSDIEELRKCYGVIVLLDQYVGCGTASEVTLAKELGMPVVGLFLEGENPRNCAPWVLSRIDKFVYSLDKLEKELLLLKNHTFDQLAEVWGSYLKNCQNNFPKVLRIDKECKIVEVMLSSANYIGKWVCPGLTLYISDEEGEKDKVVGFLLEGYNI